MSEVDPYCVQMAEFLRNAHPNILVSAHELGQVIEEVTDGHMGAMLAGDWSCRDLARALQMKFPIRMLDDEIELALTVQDWVDKLKAGDFESE